jgi:hypothetical protein
MNINKHLILLFSVLFFLFAVSVSSGCFRKNESDVKSVVRNELDQLKNLDSETTQKYIPYTELFPDATENTDLTDEINETFSLFFRKFNYKISDVIVGTANHSATVSVKLTTIDSKVLARDFKAELLRTQITESAQAQKGNIKDSSRSLEAHYLILNHLLNTNDYDTAETDCNIQLVNTGNDKKEKWKIQRTNSLEDDLVGGLMNDLTDPDILSPEDTILVYLNTLKNMTAEELGNYLNADSIISTEDPAKISLAEALVKQVHSTFDYSIGETTVSGYTATVTANITTFDSDAILENYQKELDSYLASVDAVIDGAQKRYEKSYSLLLEYIEENTATKTVETTFTLINDGASWKLEDAGTVFGQALFGTLSSSPVEDKQETNG